MKTTTQELKQYITRLFQLSNNETWECEALEEAAENILPTRFVDHTPLAHLTLDTYTYYNDELHELSIYPFLMYANNQLISIGYLDHLIWTFYLTDTKNTIIDERHLLKQGGMTMNNWIKLAQISVTVINEVIDIMKEKQNGENSMKINRYITRGISEHLSLDLQILLWNMVKERDNKPHTDYLHILDYKKMRIYSQSHMNKNNPHTNWNITIQTM